MSIDVDTTKLEWMKEISGCTKASFKNFNPKTKTIALKIEHSEKNT